MLATTTRSLAPSTRLPTCGAALANGPKMSAGHDHAGRGRAQARREIPASDAVLVLAIVRHENLLCEPGTPGPDAPNGNTSAGK